MEKSLVRSMLFVLVIIGSVAISLFGYRTYANRIYENKLEYAEATIATQTQQIQDLSTQVNALYTDDTYQFLADGLTVDAVNNLVAQISNITTTGSSFGLADDRLPESFKNLDNDKKQLLSLSRAAGSKLNVQSELSSLFSTGITSWQAFSPDVAIVADLTEERVAATEAKVSEQPDGAWKAVASQYITLAREQLAEVSEIRGLLNSYMIDGQLTAEADFNVYYTLASQIEAVESEALRAQLQEELSAFLALLNANSGTGYGLDTSGEPDYGDDTSYDSSYDTVYY